MITEDKRTERFFRGLLVALGFEKRGFRFLTAPSGVGAGEAWVREQYPTEVRYLRSRSYQALCVVAVRDGDNVGVSKRKAELDHALTNAGLAVRQPKEAIATPVPTWSIENWLLDLLGHEGVDEGQCPSDAPKTPWKRVFERDHAADERSALRGAVGAWVSPRSAPPELPSLTDGRSEMDRIG
ncbi:MAG: hypothetical protein H6732_11240 [Alphaproteobacteria bacterium]|nr:hypothetical protein [Alphaproteobacteria bacterium]